MTMNFSENRNQHLLIARLVRTERQVPDEKRGLGASCDGAAMDEHFVERDGQCGVMTVNHHGGRVTDEADIDPGSVEVHCGGIVVGGDHGDGLAFLVLLPKMGQSNPLVRVLALGSPVYCVLGDIAHGAHLALEQL